MELEEAFLQGDEINQNCGSLETLPEQINIARNRMQWLWDERGYTDEDVFAAGIEVPRLLNAYDRIRVFECKKISTLNPLRLSYGL